MPNLWSVFASIAFLSLPLALRAEKLYRKVPRLPKTLPSQVTLSLTDSSRYSSDQITEDQSWPKLSIIIPARNEADNLRRLLPSLKTIQYPGFLEVIVVDDNSTDETGRVAQTHGARLLHLTTLPPGWLGKPHACHQGAHLASGDWLLFTDADTVHTMDGPLKAVFYAHQHHLDGLSCFLTQKTSGVMDRLALLVAFAGLFAGLSEANAVLNGQYILLKRDVYMASGGFATVRHESLEDLALGKHLRKQGYRVLMLRAEAVAHVQMYRDLATLWHGLTRIGAGSLSWSGWGAFVTGLLITASMIPLLTLAAALARQLDRRWVIATWIAVIPGFITWARRFGSGWWALLAPLGAALVQIAATWGLISRLIGRGVRWKDRLV